MSEIDWKVLEAPELSPDSPRVRLAAAIGEASPELRYQIYDNGDGTFWAFVSEGRGLRSLNTTVTESVGTLEEAKALCLQDWQARADRPPGEPGVPAGLREPDVPPKPQQWLNTMFVKDSPDLREYLKKWVVGLIVYGPKHAWKVIEVRVEDRMPHPDTNEPQVCVSVILE